MGVMGISIVHGLGTAEQWRYVPHSVEHPVCMVLLLQDTWVRITPPLWEAELTQGHQQRDKMEGREWQCKKDTCGCDVEGPAEAWAPSGYGGESQLCSGTGG